MALQGLLANADIPNLTKELNARNSLADLAYKIADTMIKRSQLPESSV